MPLLLVPAAILGATFVVSFARELFKKKGSACQRGKHLWEEHRITQPAEKRASWSQCELCPARKSPLEA